MFVGRPRKINWSIYISSTDVRNRGENKQNMKRITRPKIRKFKLKNVKIYNFSATLVSWENEKKKSVNVVNINLILYYNGPISHITEYIFLVY